MDSNTKDQIETSPGQDVMDACGSQTGKSNSSKRTSKTANSQEPPKKRQCRCKESTSILSDISERDASPGPATSNYTTQIIRPCWFEESPILSDISERDEQRPATSNDSTQGAPADMDNEECTMPNSANEEDTPLDDHRSTCETRGPTISGRQQIIIIGCVSSTFNLNIR